MHFRQLTTVSRFSPGRYTVASVSVKSAFSRGYPVERSWGRGVIDGREERKERYLEEWKKGEKERGKEGKKE